jgi:exonuclease III
MHNTTHNLRLLLYNARLYSGNITSAGPEYQDKYRVNGIIRQLTEKRYDIVCLNEVWADPTKELLIKALGREYHFHYYRPNDSAAKIGSGLLLLSRFRILDSEFVGFNILADNDRQTRKGIIRTKILIPSDRGHVPLHLILTQPQGGGSEEAKRVRVTHIDSLVKYVRNLACGNQPLLVCGNMNIVAETPDGIPTSEYLGLVHRMQLLGLNDTYRQINPDPNEYPGYTVDSTRNRLHGILGLYSSGGQRTDYIFSRNLIPAALSCKVVDGFLFDDPAIAGFMDVSDHYPLAVEYAA